MAYEHKPGTFSLFKNDKKGNERAPDYRGPGKDMAGNEIEVAAWLKDSGQGKFMSCNFKPKGERPAETTKTVKQAPTGGKFDDMEDDIPF